MRPILLSAGLGLAVTLAAGAATAAPGRTETDLNLRSGPGTNYRVLTSMPGGAVVDIGACSGGWCRVAYGGYSGYASGRYLAGGSVRALPRLAGPPPASFRIGIYAGAPYYHYGNRWYHRGRWYDRRPSWARPPAIRRPAVRANRVQREIRREFRQERRQFQRQIQRDRREFRSDRREFRRDLRNDRRPNARQRNDRNRPQWRNRQNRRGN